MYLIVSSTPGCDRTALLDMVEAKGARIADAESVDRWLEACSENAQQASSKAIAQRELGSPDETILVAIDARQLQQAFAALPPDDHFRVLLFHVRPEVALLEAMQREQGIAEAMERWNDSVRAMLEVYYHNRRLAGIFEQSAVFDSREAFKNVCEKTLNITLNVDDAIEPRLIDTSEYLRLIAGYEVARDSAARTLVDELEASSLVADSSLLDIEVDSESLYRELLANGVLASGASELQEENELLLLQLNQVQQEAEHYYLDLQKEAKQRSALEQRLDAVEQDLRKTSEALKKAQKKFEQMRRSTSWRLTMPLRVLVRFVKRVLGRG